MKVRCDRSELAQCLGDVLGIVPPLQSAKPIFQYFHLKTEAGALVVEATDLDIGAKIRLERVEVLEEGDVAVPAVRAASLVREIPDKQVSIDSLPGGCGAVVSAQSCEFKLLGQDPTEFPEGPAFREDRGFGASREKFVDALRRVAVAACRDMSRYQLNGVFFEVEGDKLTMTATDGKRLTNDAIRVENPRDLRVTTIVPNRVADVLLKVLSQGQPTIQISIEDPDIQVSFGRGEMTAKVIQAVYPDYRVALGQKTTGKVTARRAELLAATKTASLMTDRQTATVGFAFSEGKVSLSTQVSDIGESRIEVPIVLEGTPMDLRFNPVYFTDALRCLADEEVQIELAEADKPVVVRGGPSYRHLVMPLVTK